MSGISTHILDTTNGKPAAGIGVQLFHDSQPISSETTNADGRISALLPADFKLAMGIYRLVFHVADYFPEAFFPEITILFQVKDTAAKYHVPLLMSAYGYSTYRGS